MTITVAVWTSGMTASAGARAILAHPDLELIGLYSHGTTKVGRDVGELIGVEPLGLASVGTVDEIVALRPDCVLYTPFRPDIDHVERLLAAGIDVVSTLNKLAGDGYGADAGRRIAAACETGGSTLYTSGLYPGNINTLALAATALCRRVDRITILESVDFRDYPNEAMYRAMGIDLEPDDPSAMTVLEEACGSFGEAVRIMAGALGVTLDDVRFEGAVAAANRTTDFGFMTVGEGRVAGFKGAMKGIAGGVSRIECQFTWTLGTDMTPSFPLQHGYVVEIEGDPSLQLRVVPRYDDDPAAGSGAAVATVMGCVNAIAQVAAAPPGILNHASLPLVVAAGRVGLPR